MCKKRTKNMILQFQSNFFELIAHSLIYHERPERIAHSCLFFRSDLSNLLTVALLTWATWAIHSQLLICPEWSERIAHSRSFDLSDLSKWAKEQIPNPEYMILTALEWPYLLKFICTKIQFVFLVLCIVFQHIFLNLWKNNTFIKFFKYIF